MKRLIYLTLMFCNFPRKVDIKGLIYPLKYNNGRDPIDLRACPQALIVSTLVPLLGYDVCM